MIEVFVEADIDAVLGPCSPLLEEGIKLAEDRTGRDIIRILTPSFNITPDGSPEQEPERVLDNTKELGATFCLPHQCVTDALLVMPIVGMTYVWNTIRDQDMVTIGCTTPDEAKEIVDLSLDLLNRRVPEQELQATRSKASLV